MSVADGQRHGGATASSPRRHLALGPGTEFDIIRQLVGRWGEAARVMGDDCAVLELPAGARLVVSTDSSVEGVHFQRSWLEPAEIGYRATAAALSDLAAAAALPLGLLLALTVPSTWRTQLADIADGVGQAARAAGAVLVGGDTSAGPALVLTVTVLGTVERELTRAGARPGDRVYVSGVLGGPAAALRALTRGATPDLPTRARFSHPVPRLREARWLAGQGISAAIDVSDGLVADLGHVAAASGVHLVLHIDRVPRWVGTTAVEAAASGEEYELAVTAAGVIDGAAFEREFGVPLTHIGEVVAGPAGVDVFDGGTRVDRVPGYDHFST